MWSAIMAIGFNRYLANWAEAATQLVVDFSCGVCATADLFSLLFLQKLKAACHNNAFVLFKIFLLQFFKNIFFVLQLKLLNKHKKKKKQHNFLQNNRNHDKNKRVLNKKVEIKMNIKTEIKLCIK